MRHLLVLLSALPIFTGIHPFKAQASATVCVFIVGRPWPRPDLERFRGPRGNVGVTAGVASSPPSPGRTPVHLVSRCVYFSQNLVYMESHDTCGLLWPASPRPPFSRLIRTVAGIKAPPVASHSVDGPRSVPPSSADGHAGVSTFQLLGAARPCTSVHLRLRGPASSCVWGTPPEGSRWVVWERHG